MTQPSNRRFVMEDRLPLESADLAAGSVTEEKIADSAVTSAKIANGTIVDADVNASAAIAATKVQGTLPTGGTTGQILSKIDGTNYNTTWIDNFAPNVELYAKNQSGSAMTKGQVVYIVGVDNAGDTPRLALADADTEPTSSKTIGRLKQDLADGEFGYVVTEGILEGLNTSAATAGQSIWLSSTAGGVVYGAPPAKPAHSVYLGVVIRAQTNNGKVYVKVQNGFELEELHNVNINSGTLASGQALTYDGSSSMWVNSTPASTLNDLTDVTINAGTLSGGQVIKYDSGTTQWVNGAAAGGVTASATAPNLSTSAAGDAWFDTNDGTLYVCYVDVDSTKQWVQVKANSALEGTILARLSSLEGQAVAFGNLSPNYIINGGFDIWQRGTSFVGTSYNYTADRFIAVRGAFAAGGTWSRQASGLAGTQYCLRVQRDSGNTSTQSLWTGHAFESVMSIPLAGKTVTFSFYARKGANMSGDLVYQLIYGTGTDQGVSSSWTGETILVSTTQALSASWTRYTATVAVPSTATQLKFNFSYAPTGTAGAADYYEVTGVQLEVGSQATAFRRNAPSIAAELAACQRYYYLHASGDADIIGTGSYYSASDLRICIEFPVTMRATPTIENVSGTDYYSIFRNSATDGFNSLAVDFGKNQNILVFNNAQVSGTAGQAGFVRTSNSAAYLAFKAEL